MRYERIRLRGSETDHITFEKFLEDERREMQSDDPTKQNIAECIRRADIIFTNNSSISDLCLKVEKALNTIQNYS
jgi:hypothetical protein